MRSPPDYAPPPKTRYLQLDLEDLGSITAACSQIGQLDVLILNGALGNGNRDLLCSSPIDLQKYLQTNTIGHFAVVQSLLPALKRSAIRTIVFMSSVVGSARYQSEANAWGFHGAYAVSKAAFNMVLIELHRELKDEQFKVVGIYPGWVDTEMGREMGGGGKDVGRTAAKVWVVLQNLETGELGKMLDENGAVIPGWLFTRQPRTRGVIETSIRRYAESD